MVNLSESRPSSDELIDLHISVVPPEHWIQRLNYASQKVVEEAFSIGFIRVHPDRTILSLRKDISEQIGEHLFTTKYVFLKHVGRCLALVREKQEEVLKAKNFITPGCMLPEIFILLTQPSTYNHMVLPPMTFAAQETSPVLSKGDSTSPNIPFGRDSPFKNIPPVHPANVVQLSKDKSATNVLECPPVKTEIKDKTVQRSLLTKSSKHTNTQKSQTRRRENHTFHSPEFEVNKKSSDKKIAVLAGLTQFQKHASHLNQAATFPTQHSTVHPPTLSHKTPKENVRKQLVDTIKHEPYPSATTMQKPKSKTSLQLVGLLANVDSGFGEDEKHSESDKSDVLRKHGSNFVGEADQILQHHNVSFEETPIHIPSFARSPNKLSETNISAKDKKLTRVKTSKRREAQPNVNGQNLFKRNETPQNQRVWRDLQDNQNKRVISQRQNLAKKSKIMRRHPSEIQKVPVLKTKDLTKAIFKPDNNSPGEKCPSCYYIFHTQADKKRHLGLVHGIKWNKTTEDKTRAWRVNVIQNASEERLRPIVRSKLRPLRRKQKVEDAGERPLTPIKFAPRRSNIQTLLHN